MTVPKSLKGEIPRTTSAMGVEMHSAPVLENALKVQRNLRVVNEARLEELKMLEELKRERDPFHYNADVWFRLPKKEEV